MKRYIRNTILLVIGMYLILLAIAWVAPNRLLKQFTYDFNEQRTDLNIPIIGAFAEVAQENWTTDTAKNTFQKWQDIVTNQGLTHRTVYRNPWQTDSAFHLEKRVVIETKTTFWNNF